MNKPYTCHNCETVFDALPDAKQEMFDEMQLPVITITVKCPGCYDAGYTSVEQMVYTLDLSTDPPTKL